ncbi:PRA1 family protein 3-like [Tropilaelaps mercedesae]|uniref:PRA1 family protein n=1 Tax=Tropilaelaps mercedesae TaxID=418985 RepID=A0A1V9XUH5_9ACAR|nr:PRA1 family protein 3-like [Tropilaelaps mercedesae]
MGDFTAPPFRSINDFFGAGARFEIPNIQDLDKWSNRVLNNLIYYQTNYFVVIGVVFVLVGLFNPCQLLVGMFATLATLALLNYLATHQAAFAGVKRQHPGLCVAIMLSGGYMIVALVGSVLVFLFGIALPVLIVFVHASLRLRNLRSKVFNQVERMGAIKTPMGLVLEQLGETFEQLVASN